MKIIVVPIEDPSVVSLETHQKAQRNVNVEV